MQWHLNRIGALVGGAEVVDIIGDEYDLDRDDGMGNIQDEFIDIND